MTLRVSNPLIMPVLIVNITISLSTSLFHDIHVLLKWHEFPLSPGSLSHLHNLLNESVLTLYLSLLPHTRFCSLNSALLSRWESMLDRTFSRCRRISVREYRASPLIVDAPYFRMRFYVSETMHITVTDS
ncbi:hypothetical protein PUN28_009699 [Cardiocondyla obscurior]|uniref:Uncharacterized protein n=1 Tax=Cardiocondyla obscurior TaxID=286306 RepID=A0AAW2FV26_9HYME